MKIPILLPNIFDYPFTYDSSNLDLKLGDYVIVPFGTGSIVSCDTTGNYFNVWMNGFQPERYYKFEIKYF